MRIRNLFKKKVSKKNPIYSKIFISDYSQSVSIYETERGIEVDIKYEEGSTSCDAFTLFLSKEDCIRLSYALLKFGDD